MPSASVPRNRIADGSLPSICIVCGAKAVERRFPGISSPSLAWVLVSPLIGLLAFWGYILMGGGQRQDRPAGFPVGQGGARVTRRSWERKQTRRYDRE